MKGELIDVSSLAPLKAPKNPVFLGSNAPKDLTSIKRSSVCLIIRGSGSEQEILLIKRTVRPEDRWSGHIALPGGRQEPGENDLETAVRECREEVGIDLQKTTKFIGPLEPRLIRISWGRKIALILCPFVFQIRPGHENVKLVSQESEVAAVFWHPLSSLVDPANRTWHAVPVRSRVSLSGIFGAFIKQQAGDILFDAVKIWPTFHTEQADGLPPVPWEMWGITLALIQDLRKLIEPGYTSDQIQLPTFGSPDLRALLSLASYRYTRRKRKALSDDSDASDLTNRLLDGYFSYFPWVIGTGIVLRMVAVAAAVKLALQYRNGKL